MLFQLPVFFVFLTVFTVILILCPPKLKFPFVFFASLVFYAWWYPPYTFFLLIQVVLAWFCVQMITKHPARLSFTIVVVLLPLIFFKYTDFLLTALESLTHLEFPRLNLILPLGISFVTFTIISLLVDVSRASNPPAYRFNHIAVYITFFPHLIAGPILRARQMIPQLKELHFCQTNILSSLALFAVGISKKVLIADPIGHYVDSVYASSSPVGGWEAWLGAFGFTIQIYCDFSAYSDMAIALAALFGIQFPENFQSPYISSSMTEIWRRWHMTLSFWLRDYLFVPLHARLRIYSRHLSLIITMAIAGLWHGANWTFVFWGLLNGLIMTVENVTGYAVYATQQRKYKRYLCVGLTFFLWLILLIFFRAPDLNSAIDILVGMSGTRGWGPWPFKGTLTFFLCLFVLIVHPYDQVNKIRALSLQIPSMLLMPILIMVILGCSILALGRPQSFYYFDF